MAGAAEIKKYILPKDYPGIDFSKFSIYLIEGSNRTLGAMSTKASEASGEYLTHSVQLITETFVKSYDGTMVTLSDGKIIPASTLIWAAGIKGNYIEGLDEKKYGLPIPEYR